MVEKKQKRPHPAVSSPDTDNGRKGTKQKKGRTLFILFLTSLSISAFTFGGGFVIVNLMKRKYVDGLKWMDEKEMLDFAAMAQSAPGAIAVNAAVLVGWKVGGFAGMLVAVLGTILPPMALLSLLSFFYAAFAEHPWVAVLFKGMQAGVAAVILDVACSLGAGVWKEKSVWSLVILLAAFVSQFFFHVNVMLIILAAAGVGIGKLLVLRHRKGERL